MKSIYDMNGTERAAALLVAIGPELASEIIKKLDGDSVQKISEEIANVGNLSVEEREYLIGEFLIDLRKNSGALYGGDVVAREMLVAALGEEKAEDIFLRLTRRDLERGFDFLKDIDTTFLVSFLQNEHPQTITITLAHLPSEKSAEILKSLDSGIAVDIARRMARMDKTSPEAVMEIARVIRMKYEEVQTSGDRMDNAGGVGTLVDILNHMSGDQEKTILDHFDANVPEIAREIKDKIFTFENMLNLTNKEIRLLIDEIGDDHILAVALKGAGDDIRIKFLRNMSRNRATDIISDIDEMGPLRISEIQGARDEILTVVRRLNEWGLIIVRKEREKFVE